MALSQSEIYTLALHAGLSKQKATVAAAIAMAESSGNPNAHNPVPPDNSYGLWQINMKGKLGPARRAEFGLKSNEDLYVPKTNARVMSEISFNGTNFKAWSTYKNGAYKNFMDNPVEKTSNSTVDALKGLPGAGAVVDTSQAIVQASEVLTKTAVWLSNPQNWIRVAYVVGGGAVIIGGIVMVVQSSSVGQKVTKAAGKALPI